MEDEMKKEKTQHGEQEKVLSLEDGSWKYCQRRMAFQDAALLSCSEVSE